jgi:hypothetical protein
MHWIPSSAPLRQNQQRLASLHPCRTLSPRRTHSYLVRLKNGIDHGNPHREVPDKGIKGYLVKGLIYLNEGVDV